MSPVHHLILGDPRHGVTRLGRLLAGPSAIVTSIPKGPAPASAALALPDPSEAPFVHVHLNDDLLGDDPLAAIARLRAGRRVAVTLHDVPQPQEGATRYARRRELYRRLAEASDLVIVCSHHERASLARCGFAGAVAVVEHPIDARAARATPAPGRTVGVLGWVHPGKGHELVLAAMAHGLPGGTLLAIGAASPGHDAYARELRAVADDARVQLQIMGYLSDDELVAACEAVVVPVCAHRHISASGSLGAWMAAGRAPLVTDGPYAREVHARCPGALHVIEGSLSEAIAATAADPARTMLRDPRAVGPTTREAVRRQAELLARWAAA